MRGLSMKPLLPKLDTPEAVQKFIKQCDLAIESHRAHLATYRKQTAQIAEHMRQRVQEARVALVRDDHVLLTDSLNRIDLLCDALAKSTKEES